MGEMTTELQEAMAYAARRSHVADDVTTKYLRRLGLEPTPDVLEHLAILEAALKLYGSRSQGYGQHWRRHGAVGNACKLALKGERPWRAWLAARRTRKDDEMPGLDDALDVINYAAFLIRCAAEGNMDG